MHEHPSHRHHIDFLHSMLKRGIVFLFFFLFFLAGFFTSENLIRGEVNDEMKKNEECQSQLKQARIPRKVTDQDVSLSIQKSKALESVISSTLFFSSRVSRSTSNRIEVVISMEGGAHMKADAADLVLTYSDNLRVIEVLPGKAFPSYPRKTYNDHSITITGLASFGSNGVTLGQANELFATVVFEKMGSEKGVVSIDTSNTNVLLEAKPVLDSDKSFSKIEL